MKLGLILLSLVFDLNAFGVETPAHPTDPFAGAFFPPELVLLARERIGLTLEQQKAVHTLAEQTQSEASNLQAKLMQETSALANLVKQERVDPTALGAQLDRVLDQERALKHLQLSLLASIKNLLRPEQQTTLREHAKDHGAQLADETRQRFTAKVERIQQAVQHWAADGRDPSAIAHTMETKVRPLIDQGKVIEAEAELDRLLVQLAPTTK